VVDEREAGAAGQPEPGLIEAVVLEPELDRLVERIDPVGLARRRPDGVDRALGSGPVGRLVDVQRTSSLGTMVTSNGCLAVQASSPATSPTWT